MAWMTLQHGGCLYLFNDPPYWLLADPYQIPRIRATSQIAETVIQQTTDKMEICLEMIRKEESLS